MMKMWGGGGVGVRSWREKVIGIKEKTQQTRQCWALQGPVTTL